MPEPADPSHPALRPAAPAPAPSLAAAPAAAPAADGAADCAADRAADRAERARRNGACSRGPVTAAGKAAASRNALRHGLCAQVHLVLPGEDAAAFTDLAVDVLAEIAPEGAVESFLAGRLAAAMWQTGRADRLEAQAFAAGAMPDPDRLRLALRYRGSIGRDLFRTLRELRPQLRAAATARAEAPPFTATASDDDLPLPTHALHAWGGPRVEPGPACSRPHEPEAAEPVVGACEPSDPALDDQATVLRHGLTLADLLTPTEAACTSEPDGRNAGRADVADGDCPGAPGAAAARQNEPGASAASTSEPEPWRAGRADPADSARPRAPGGAAAVRPNEPSAPAGRPPEPERWASAPPEAAGSDGPSRLLVDSVCRNEPNAPRRVTVAPLGATDPSVPAGIPDGADVLLVGRPRHPPGSEPPPDRAADGALAPAGGMAGPTVDAWSRLWGLTPPPDTRRDLRRGRVVAAHPGDDPRQRARTLAASPAAAEDGAIDAAIRPAAATPVAPPPRDGAAGSAERDPCGVGPSPPAPAEPARRAEPPCGVQRDGRRRVLSRQHRAPAAIAMDGTSCRPASPMVLAADVTAAERERTSTPPGAPRSRWQCAVG